MIHSLLQLDAALRDAIVGVPRPIWFDQVMVAATIAGRGAAVWFGLAVLTGLAGRGRAAAAFRAGLAILLTMLIIDLVLKPWIARERPFDRSAAVRMLDTTGTTYSFPSGHTANSVAAAFSLGRAWPAARPAFWTLAAIVSLSRIFVGAHYPLDLLGGAVVGFACAYFVTGGARPRSD